MKNTKTPLPRIVIFAILTTITTIVWIGFDVYRAFTKDSAPDVPAEILRPLSADLDPDTLSGAVNRVHLEDTEIGNTSIIQPTPVPVEFEAIEEIATNSAETEEETTEETEEGIE